MVLKRIFGGRDPDTQPSDDPRVRLEQAVARRAEEYASARLGLAEVATGRRRIELLVDRHRAEIGELDDAARDQLRAGREDEARRLLVRRAGLLEQVESLTAHRDQIAAQVEQMRELTARMRDDLDRMQAEKATVLATLSAAEAQERAAAALAAVPGAEDDPRALLAQARDRAESLSLRAGADAEVATASARGREPGVGDPVERHLDELRRGG
ncbi:PspA/IM30 family protein [Pseudonocardia benzenivorans]|jgi:phage shock protein A|uniref:PspA/IM30 family protein n=2 Tax=Pseudonocardia TaxID=1847 RepID=F4CNK3_PSEUX|nr:PspA/IM30 family protein [Pseudonocardia dioxanivorans]AEA28301.1 PspA/IM30 family protein [Pseudonocardia dioxanivorans CB1190]